MAKKKKSSGSGTGTRRSGMSSTTTTSSSSTSSSLSSVGQKESKANKKPSESSNNKRNTKKKKRAEAPFPLYQDVSNAEISEGFESIVNLLRGRKNIVVLVGAGISVSCGIPDFRSKGRPDLVPDSLAGKSMCLIAHLLSPCGLVNKEAACTAH